MRRKRFTSGPVTAEAIYQLANRKKGDDRFLDRLVIAVVIASTGRKVHLPEANPKHLRQTYSAARVLCGMMNVHPGRIVELPSFITKRVGILFVHHDGRVTDYRGRRVRVTRRRRHAESQ